MIILIILKYLVVLRWPTVKEYIDIPIYDIIIIAIIITATTYVRRSFFCDEWRYFSIDDGSVVFQPRGPETNSFPGARWIIVSNRRRFDYFFFSLVFTCKRRDRKKKISLLYHNFIRLRVLCDFRYCSALRIVVVVITAGATVT